MINPQLQTEIVERAIGYVRSSFFQARRYADLEDLNRQAEEWSTTVAMERRWPEDKRLSVREAFEHEKEKLIAVPPYSFPCEDRLETTVGKTPYVRFDLNDYSVPHTVCREPIVLLASDEEIRILHDGENVAEHLRSYDRDAQIDNPAHIDKLREEKSAASRHDRVHLLAKAVPSSAQLVVEASSGGSRTPNSVASSPCATSTGTGQRRLTGNSSTRSTRWAS